MSKVPQDKLQQISKAASDVLLMLADKHPDHGNFGGRNSEKMVEFWDFLNDKAAPPAVVKAMADELLELRQHNQRLKQQRILDRRRFDSRDNNIIRLNGDVLNFRDYVGKEREE